METCPPAGLIFQQGAARLPANKICQNPDPPPLEEGRLPPFLERHPHPNRPLISMGPVSPACGKFSAAPHPHPRILVRGCHVGGACSPHWAASSWAPPTRSHCLKLGVCIRGHQKQGPLGEGGLTQQRGAGKTRGQWDGPEQSLHHRLMARKARRELLIWGLQTVLSKVLRTCFGRQVGPITKGFRVLQPFNPLQGLWDLWLENKHKVCWCC